MRLPHLLLVAFASLCTAKTTCTTCSTPAPWCAPLARDALLAQHGCDKNPLSTFLHPGGETVASHPGSPCSARFCAPENEAIYVACTELKEKLDAVLVACGDGGLMVEGQLGETWLRGWAVDTCGQPQGQEVLQRD
jgi:hypothetical protein